MKTRRATRGGLGAAGTTAPVGMHLLLNGEFLSPPSVYSLFLLSSLHPHGHLKFTYDKQTESVSLSLFLARSSFSISATLIPPTSSPRAYRGTRIHTSKGSTTRSSSYMHLARGRCHLCVGTWIYSWPERQRGGWWGGRGEWDAQGETRDNLNHVAIYLSRESGYRRIKLASRRLFFRPPNVSHFSQCNRDETF